MLQEGWRRLHEGAEQDARQAERGDREVTAVYTQYDTQWKQVSNSQGFSCHSCQLVGCVQEEPRLLLKEHHYASTLVHL